MTRDEAFETAQALAADTHQAFGVWEHTGWKDHAADGRWLVRLLGRPAPKRAWILRDTVGVDGVVTPVLEDAPHGR